jgi:Transposase DDE domain group 1
MTLTFHDERHLQWIEHEVATLVGQRVFGIALGYDLNNHDELRHDPMMQYWRASSRRGREDRAPVAGKSTLNRLELGGHVCAFCYAPTRASRATRPRSFLHRTVAI